MATVNRSPVQISLRSSGANCRVAAERRGRLHRGLAEGFPDPGNRPGKDVDDL
jgi:siroheme synthase (precorrin-2 oxidase/ferrochelatase)